jgi:hypothetical protein
MVGNVDYHINKFAAAAEWPVTDQADVGFE